MKIKLLASLSAAAITCALIYVGVCQWNGVEIHISGKHKWVGAFFNGLREDLGDKPSSIITFALILIPMFAALDVIRKNK